MSKARCCAGPAAVLHTRLPGVCCACSPAAAAAARTSPSAPRSLSPLIPGPRPSQGMVHSPSLEALAAAAEAPGGDPLRGRQLGRVALLKKEFGFIRQARGLRVHGLAGSEGTILLAAAEGGVWVHPPGGLRVHTMESVSGQPLWLPQLLKGNARMGAQPTPLGCRPCRHQPARRLARRRWSARETCSSTSRSWRAGGPRTSRWADREALLLLRRRLQGDLSLCCSGWRAGAPRTSRRADGTRRRAMRGGAGGARAGAGSAGPTRSSTARDTRLARASRLAPPPRWVMTWSTPSAATATTPTSCPRCRCAPHASPGGRAGCEGFGSHSSRASKPCVAQVGAAVGGECASRRRSAARSARGSRACSRPPSLRPGASSPSACCPGPARPALHRSGARPLVRLCLSWWGSRCCAAWCWSAPPWASRCAEVSRRADGDCVRRSSTAAGSNGCSRCSRRSPGGCRVAQPPSSSSEIQADSPAPRPLLLPCPPAVRRHQRPDRVHPS